MHKTIKIIVLLCFAVFLVSNTVMVSYAHDSQEEHYKEICSVLFGNSYSENKEGIKEKISAIKYASYITIDQFGGKGIARFKTLKSGNMLPITTTFKSIDYSYDPINQSKGIGPNNHRAYTHQGWDRVYENQNVQAFWTKRRNVLLSTINSIFEFQPINIFGYSDKCNSLAGIIYYIHILGDYAEADKYTQISKLPDLAVRIYANDENKDYDMITSLKRYIEILFADQRNSKDLIRELEKIEKPAAKLVQSNGGVNTDEEFAEYKGYALEILSVLQKYVPDLLKEEPFFRNVFYPELPKKAA